MTALLIEGARRLSGRVHVEGNKNAALPLLAACLLTTEECVLTNMPRIRDVEVMARLLVDLGAEVEGIGTTTLRVRCREVVKDEPDPALVGRLRGSVLLIGPLLARRGRARLAPPGGDFPARRSLSTHLEALTSMGARIVPGAGHHLEAPDGLQPTSIFLFEASVTGTETTILAAAAAPGVSEIRHAACEPHVEELCRFLSKLGVPVTGGGTSTIRIEGGVRLSGASHHLWGDYIEAGSWAVVAAVTGGDIEVSGARAEDIEVIAAVFERLNLECGMEGETFRVERSRARTPAGPGPAGRRLTTGLWPGFPSDLVSLVTVLATQADGRTLVHDWLYELRLFALEQLSGMGAELFLCDPHRIIVTGPRRLTGRALDSRDLRSGMALIAAALAADGESRLSPLETVERGYGQLVERLQGLGARVERQTDAREPLPL
jgi:UDP-N-acetylglucosamine 1-carboxyvinyltransferase